MRPQDDPEEVDWSPIAVRTNRSGTEHPRPRIHDHQSDRPSPRRQAAMSATTLTPSSTVARGAPHVEHPLPVVRVSDRRRSRHPSARRRLLLSGMRRRHPLRVAGVPSPAPEYGRTSRRELARDARALSEPRVRRSSRTSARARNNAADVDVVVPPCTPTSFAQFSHPL